ncbi:ISL3 family transposase, partial [Staphylococcus sp. H16/1A]|nr:ISL3 family transposase [Staphylococcus canis]
DRPLYNKFKRFWKLYLKPIEDLEAFEYRKVPLFKSWKTQKGIVQYLNEQNEMLSRTHFTVNQLRCHINNNDIEGLLQSLENVALPDIHPKLRTVIKTLKSYIPFITNTLEYANFTN